MNTFALQPYERRVIKAVLRFANLRQIDEAVALRCFGEVFDVRKWMLDVGLKVGEAEVFFERAVRLHFDNARVRTWLDRIIRSSSERKAVAREVAPLVEETVSSALRFDGRRLEQSYEALSSDGACALAAALILDERRGLTNRLKRCGWCDRFNLQFDPKGRPRRFCTDEHARLFSNRDSKIRQQRYRQKHKRKGNQS